MSRSSALAAPCSADGSALLEPEATASNVFRLAVPAALVAYISDFRVVDGARVLTAQAACLDASRHARCGIAARYIDSGRPDGPPCFGHALRALILDAREKRFRAVVVESICRLAPDLATALLAAIEIAATGVEIYEVHGGRLELEPGIIKRVRAQAS